ncbi:methylmalonyl-CoA mutase family protein [Streptomyces sp. NPDC053367]|uniref:methylmalonyl-CoA mutase family protein n=1 Tax=Streptomyces sp. NPDC053367 TaxID=3365700 RepID=UPI0037D43C7D
MPSRATPRWRGLIAGGTRTLPVAYVPVAHGRSATTGVVIDSLDDLRVLFRGVPLDTVSPSLPADAPAALLLALYRLVAEEQGVSARRLTGTLRTDAPGRRLFPPEPSRRLLADLAAYREAELPRWTTTPRRARPRVPGAAGPRRPEPLTLRFHADAYDGAVPAAGPRHAERLAKLRAWRCQDRLDDALHLIRKAAAGTDNVLHPISTALAAGATTAEVCQALHEAWGT